MVSVRSSVIGVLIADLIPVKRGRALLAGEEIHIRCDHISLEIRSYRHRRIIVNPRLGAIDVVPTAGDVNRFGKRDCHAGVARSICTIVARVCAEDGRTNLNDGCRASWIWGSSGEVSRVVIAVSGAVVS